MIQLNFSSKMYSLWSFMLIISIIEPFIQTAHKYNDVECKIKCEKEHGTLYREGRTVGMTTSEVDAAGKCYCDFNAQSILIFLDDFDLNYQEFKKWYDMGACVGRLWLSLHNIEVQYPKHLPSLRVMRNRAKKAECELAKKEKEAQAARLAKEKEKEKARAAAAAPLYTLKTCTNKCNEEEGYIVIVPGNRTAITVPYLWQGGKKCTCASNIPPVYKFLKENNLDADAFFKARNKDSVCGRKWLLKNNIRVDFRKTLTQRFHDKGTLSERFKEADEGKDGLCAMDSLPPERAEWTRLGRPFSKDKQKTQGNPEPTKLSGSQSSTSVTGTSKPSAATPAGTSRPPAQPKKSEIEEIGP